MILSDHSILDAIEDGRLDIDPFDPSHVQPCSYDVTLSRDFLVQPFWATTSPRNRVPIDPLKEGSFEMDKLLDRDEFVVNPSQFCLGATIERIALPSDIAGRIEGKSSLARLGLVIHQTAGFLDAGFVGQVTLELVNVALRPIVLYPGMKIGQISFIQMTTPADRPYGSHGLNSKYQNQDGPTGSQYHTNVEPERALTPASEVTPEQIADRFSQAMQWRRRDSDTGET